MKSTSLIRRTIIVVLLAELLSAIALSVTALHHERRTRLRAFDVMLHGRSDSVLGAIQDSEDPDDHVAINPLELKVPPGDIFAVYDPEGRIVGASARSVPDLTAREAEGFFNRSADGRRYRVFEREGMRVIDRDENGGQGLQRPVTIVYAADTENIWQEIWEAARFYAMVSSILLILTGGVLVLLLRRILEPIQELAERARAVSVLAPSFEAPLSALHVRELQPLARTLTVAIRGLSEALEKQHRFVGDAAHELKTAVAVVRSTIQVQMMRPRSREEYMQGLELLLADNGRVEELVAQMLLLARMEERSTRDTGLTDLSVVVAAVIAKLQSFAEVHETRLVGELDSVSVHITAEKVDLLVSNLIVNAIQHSAAGSLVKVSTSMQGGAASIQVRDHGSGISASALPHVFERFYREDVSRSRETGGSGLGLAICKSVMDSVGGHITVDSLQGSGTTVSVTFRPSPEV